MFIAKVNQRRRNLVRGSLRLESLETRRLFAGDLGFESAVDRVVAVSSNDATQAAEVAVQESSSVALVWDQVSSHDPLDTNGDGRVTANDALLVINYMGRQDSRSEGEDTPRTDLDANGDERVSALDALVIINRLDRIEPVSAEPSEEEPVSYTNPVNRYDVDDSGNVSAADVDVIYAAL